MRCIKEAAFAARSLFRATTALRPARRFILQTKCFSIKAMSKPPAWFRSPVSLLVLTACLLSFAVQSGELGTADTMHRLQTAHSFWTGEPQVFPNEFPEFGVHGKGGVLQSWYGIGQSLLLLPF